MNDWHEVSHDLLILVSVFDMPDIFKQVSDYLEVFRDDVAWAHLLHAEHENWEECVLHLRVTRMLKSLLTDS